KHRAQHVLRLAVLAGLYELAGVGDEHAVAPVGLDLREARGGAPAAAIVRLHTAVERFGLLIQPRLAHDLGLREPLCRYRGALPLEAQRVDRGDRHVLEQRREERAELAVAAAHRQRDAIGPKAARALLESILPLREVESGAAREAVQPLDMRVELRRRREQQIEAAQLLRPAVHRD